MLVNNWYNEANINQHKINRQEPEKWAIVCVNNVAGYDDPRIEKCVNNACQSERFVDLTKRLMLRQAQHDNI
jgi:hypothetical protein